MWAGFDGPQVPGELLDAIAGGRIGGLLLFAYRKNLSSKEQVRAMLREAQAAARRGGLPPVPVAVDQEGGTVVRVAYRAVFPSAMALGAGGDPADAEAAARAVAEGLLADGITVNHAPVCDLNVEPRNPVIGIRAFGDDPEQVAAFAAAWVRGSEGAGVATTPKHFPGHGDAPHDSHHAAFDVTADRATLERRELAPFRAALAAGASGVMTAHIRYPALDAGNIATLSPTILIDLLRERLGFEGLVITDSLDMKGVGLVEKPERVVGRAVRAGVDAVMVTSGLDRQLAAAERIASDVPGPRIIQAVRRAGVFRERFGRDVPDDDIDDAPRRALAERIARASITHVGPPLPSRERGLRAVALPPLSVSPAEELRDPIGTLETALRRRFGDRLAFARDGASTGSTARGRRAEDDAPLAVFSSGAFFDEGQAARVRELLARGGILCALRTPYDATLVPDRAALLTYGDVPASLEALAAVLAGELEATGKLPVSFDHVAYGR